VASKIRKLGGKEIFFSFKPIHFIDYFCRFETREIFNLDFYKNQDNFSTISSAGSNQLATNHRRPAALQHRRRLRARQAQDRLAASGVHSPNGLFVFLSL
jgi:hypothetical protein